MRRSSRRSDRNSSSDESDPHISDHDISQHDREGEDAEEEEEDANSQAQGFASSGTGSVPAAAQQTLTPWQQYHLAPQQAALYRAAHPPAPPQPTTSNNAPPDSVFARAFHWATGRRAVANNAANAAPKTSFLPTRQQGTSYQDPEEGKKPESYLHGNNVAKIKRKYPVTEVANPINLLDLGVVIADVISFLPIKDQVPFLAASVEVHQWYDTCVEFRMAVAYTDAPYKKESNGNVDAWFRSLPSTKPRWDYAPINFEQHSAGYLQNDELAPSQRKPMKVVPEVSYFNLRSLCCSTMVSKGSGLLTQAGKLNIDDDTKGDDFYDATNSLDAGDYLLAGLVAKHVVIKSTGGVSSIGRGFLRSTTAHTVTIAADRYTGSNVCAPKSIGSGWFGDCKNLRVLDCAGFDYVEAIGDRWLERSGELESVSFTGLRNLRTVGESWLHGCPKLTHVDFSGLGKLETVNGWWLRDCASLETVDFKGLKSLTSPGHRWLELCPKLKHVDKTGLPTRFKESQW